MNNEETKSLRAFKEKQLKDGESILLFMEGYIGEMMGKGSNEQFNGMLILTTERVAFYCKGGLLSSEVLHDIRLDQINSVNSKSGLVQRVLELKSSSGVIEFKTYEKDKYLSDFYNEVKNLRRNKDEQQIDPYEELKKLKSLFDTGVIDEATYNAKRDPLLAKIGI